MGLADDLAKLLRLNDGEQAYTGYPQMQVGLNKPRQAGYATGFLEGATGMDSMQPKNPITDPNYSAYEQGKNTGELAGIGAMAVPGYAAALRAGAPKAYNALENYMVKSGGMIPLEAWHGTPHKIEGAFDINKVGTGEGAQAYGHGMYFAQNPKVAEGYQQTLGKAELSVGGKDLEGSQKFVADRLRNSNYEDTLNWINSNKKSFGKEKTAEYRNALESLKETSIEARTGNLYKVDIPDEHIPTMMDWDKSLGEQSPFVKKAVNSLKKQITPEMMDELGGDLNVLFGKDVTPAQFLNTWEIIHPESKIGIGEELLNQAGVKGVRYLDNASRDAGKGTSNFVVFDPSTVKILEENGKPLSRKEILEKQVSNLKPEFSLTKEQFLGNPKITSNANASDLKPLEIKSLSSIEAEPFLGGKFEAKYSPKGAVVLEDGKPVASYNFGSELSVDPKYRKQGIAKELVYEWRTRFPDEAKATTRTKASQAIQEKVWDRIQKEKQ